MRFRDTELVGIGAAACAAWLMVGDGLAAAAIVVLCLMGKLLITGDGIPALPMALLFQWVQVSLGVFYGGTTGRAIETMRADYRPMVWIGLIWVLMISIGIRAGVWLVRRKTGPDVPLAEQFLTWPVLLISYAVSIFLTGALVAWSWQYPALRQVLVTATVVRLGLLFLILRRLAQPSPRWSLFGAVVAFEVILGFANFFAGFREPLVLAAVALLERLNLRDRRKLAGLAVLSMVMVICSFVWMGVRATYRAEVTEIDAMAASQSMRINRVSTLGSGLLSQSSDEMAVVADNVVDRIWAIYYPALAVSRVPGVYPHTGGTMMWTAIQHVLMPRIFFPDKGEMQSDSELVRKYSGVMVAGREQNTSIAFGAAAESYVDFGQPIMFIPPLVFGLLMGAAYAWILHTIRHRELAVATVIVVFWLSLYLFERGWANMLGDALSLIVYLAIPIVLFDKFVLVRRVERAAAFTTTAHAPGHWQPTERY